MQNEKRSPTECQRWAKATCSVRGSPSGWRNESNLFDFHELRQGFIPPIQNEKRSRAGKSVLVGIAS